MAGLPDGSFRPDEPVLRKMLASLLVRLAQPDAELQPCTAPPYADVPVENLHCPMIRWLRHQGLVTGYPDTTFRPEQPVSRGVLAAILVRRGAP